MQQQLVNYLQTRHVPVDTITEYMTTLMSTKDSKVFTQYFNVCPYMLSLSLSCYLFVCLFVHLAWLYVRT
jgi:hypothetical protein